MRDRVRKPRDIVVAGCVLIGHVILVLLFARAREHERSEAGEAQRTMLISIPPREPTSPSASTEPPSIAQPTLIIVPPPPLPEIESSAPASSTPRSIDWRREAARSADTAIRMQSAPGPRGFEERAPAESPVKPKAFGWDPSPGKVGISGGLPYVEVGKRCVIGLGFFGCAIGELPAPNGELFEGMDDPNRDRSSVPEVTR